ncbi:serine hydrolase domain-containing protein [Brevibacterium yomogidense]|uniref:serine hydrolase domain-containing protein n=1 Tax=Brevibacterium yomogidense TaxID=946573 RepID=UPI0018DF5CDB|nr:serine hydrolase domain-containing protein [Brevibacterium yomogidense]
MTAASQRFRDPAVIRAHMIEDQERMRTRRVRRGAPSDLALGESEPLRSLSDLMVPGVGGKEVPLSTFLDSADATGLLVLHRGRPVHSGYRHGFRPDDLHVTASISKSVFALLVMDLVRQGEIDLQAPVSRYVPELAGTGFGDALVDHCLHMLTEIRYGGRPFHKEMEARAFFAAVGMVERPPGYSGPTTLLDRLATAESEHPSGRVFRYENGNTEALGEVVRRVTGRPVAELLSALLYRQLGAVEDAHFALDTTGRELVSGRFACTLGDLARIGEVIRCGGAVGDRQVLAESLVAGLFDVPDGPAGDVLGTGDERTGGAPVLAFNQSWWLPLDGEGAVVARGRSGQRLYVSPRRDTVIALYGAHPVADDLPLPVFEPALARIAQSLQSL